MVAQDMLSEEVFALKTSDTGIFALNWMEIFKVSHLPIVNDKLFLGLISENDIYDQNTPNEPLGNHPLSLQHPYVTYDQHIFEVMEVMSLLKLSLVPVLDFSKLYIGSITIHDLLLHFTNFSALLSKGGIIELDMNSNDYSLSQICQIVEGNNAKILATHVTAIPHSTQIKVTLKLNVTDLTSIKQTFQRYNYNISGSFLKHDEETEVINSRYEFLLKYLDI